jgi:predicted ATPase
MLTSLEIENFKGIGVRQRIDFAPLTLLFGANSAGKSTILQALVYLHELLERGSADVDRTELGGHVLELGGFARLVHKHDTTSAIVMRAEFATPASLERFGRDLTAFPFADLDDEVESAWLELRIASHKPPSEPLPLGVPPHVYEGRGPVIDQVRIGLNGIEEPLVEISPPMFSRSTDFAEAKVNLGHPLIREAAEALQDDWFAAASSRSRLVADGSPEAVAEAMAENPLYGRGMPVFVLTARRLGTLPNYGEPLRIVTDTSTPSETALDQVRTFLEMVVLGTTAQLASFLRGAQYLGPLRTIPPRGFLYERAGRITSWADGLAAWDLLLADRLTLIERTNAWLRKLGAGCQVVVQQLFDRGADAEELSDGHVDKTVRRLLLDTGVGSLVLPSEVGAGISQLIPVVVAAIEGRGGLTLVEQPEIHVHPAVQVGLGDLLIEAAKAGGRRMLVVETHSEHLILRLLRRIREATETSPAGDAPAFSQRDLSVIYVDASAEGVRVRRLRVDEHGEFVDRWPKGFFAERMEELL